MSSVPQPPAESSGAIISILDLPKGSVLTLDGQLIQLQRQDFVGIRGVPIDYDDDDDDDSRFHLVVARAAGCGTAEEQKKLGNVAALSVGFSVDTALTTTNCHPMALLRRYDPVTEEVSSKDVDPVTATNLVANITQQQIEPHRLIPYDSVVSTEQSTAWQQLTNFVTQKFLQDRGIHNGSKIIPGCYEEEDEKEGNLNAAQHIYDDDGASVKYPPIPVLLLDGKKQSVLQHRQHSHRRHHHHLGTKRYLAGLSPSDRTALFLGGSSPPQNALLESVLQRWYGSQWYQLLADVQLSYVLFLHLRCLSSLEHWRDLVAMLSSVDSECVNQHVDLYCNLLEVLARQVTTIEQDFFEDVATSGDNFLVPALKNLIRKTGGISVQHNIRLQQARTTLCQILQNRFRDTFASVSIYNAKLEEEHKGDDVEMEGQPSQGGESDKEEDDEEDMPVVISNEEVQASLARSSLSSSSPLKPAGTDIPTQQYYPISLQRKYPILFAAKMDHEDILMVCARALDEATDVSLVREAGTFLVEEVEPDTTTSDLYY